MESSKALKEHFYPEARVGGFSRVDGSMEFYLRISSLIRLTDVVLDYGAGRGAQIETDSTRFGRWLKTLRGRVAHVEGCDVDPAVFENPYLDHATLLDPNSERLPFEDETFDLIYSNWVFEHISNPSIVAKELLRVTKSGGYICAVTPNKRGYIAVASRLAGNTRHVSLLRKVQPDRLEVDVFPTHYQLNTKSAIERFFGLEADVTVYGMSSEPSYHFDSKLIYRIFKLVHRFTPASLHTALFIFMKKR